VVVRVVVVALAVAAVVVLGIRLREHDRCQSAQKGTAVDVAKLSANCRDPDLLASASFLLVTAGKRAEGERLAQESVRREPDGFAGWVALALAQPDRNSPRARRAVARAKALNPRWQGLPRAGAQGP
jgi:predicted Zn-dependent protease